MKERVSGRPAPPAGLGGGSIARRLGAPQTIVPLVILAVLLLTAVFAGAISPSSRATAIHTEDRLLPPGPEHWFGTDALGRDVFTRIIHGGRLSLALGIIPSLASMVFALLLGSASGYFGGRLDEVTMRVTDALLCVPGALLSLALASALGPGFISLLAALTVSQVPHFTRIVRSITLTIVENEYIAAAVDAGAGHWRIISRHVIRNALGPVIVQTAFSMAGMILTGAGLSFIGLGAQPPAPEWGAMLSDAREFLRRAPHLAIFPGACILVSALCFNMLGDALRDALD